MDRARFRSLAKYLKQRLPLSEPVTVSVCRVPRRRIGDCISDGKRFTVRIETSLGTEEACGTLLHEVAHVISWGLDGPDDADSHGAIFKHAERTVWGWYLDWLRGE